jgi:hypothetical protein
MPDGDGKAPGGLDRLLEHLDSYFLVAELVAGWRAGLLAAMLEGPGTAAESPPGPEPTNAPPPSGSPCSAREAWPTTTAGCSRPWPASRAPSTQNASAST